MKPVSCGFEKIVRCVEGLRHWHATARWRKKKKSRSCFCREALKAAAKRHGEVTKPHGSTEDNMSSCRGRSHLQHQHQHQRQGHGGELSPDQKKQENWILAQFCDCQNHLFDRFRPVEQWNLQRHPGEGRGTPLDSHQNSGSSIKMPRIFSPTLRKIKTGDSSQQFSTRWSWHLAANRPINGVCQPLEGCSGSVSSNHLSSPSWRPSHFSKLLSMGCFPNGCVT